MRNLLARQEAGVDTESKRVWALFMLEQWHREFIDPSLDGDTSAGGVRPELVSTGESETL